MDLSFVSKSQGETLKLQNKFPEELDDFVFNFKETLQETDFKGDDNLLISLKTETNSNHNLNPNLVLKDVMNYENEKNLEVENSIFNYSSFRKAMDLRIHSGTEEEKKRTIFDDAEYFSRNYTYKLLPITSENVDEAIIHTEHNYCNFYLSSESDEEEDCSRTMDYSQIKEKNYKRRKTKFNQLKNENKSENSDVEGHGETSLLFSTVSEENQITIKNEEHSIKIGSTEDSSSFTQPLDLSAPLVQEEKTDHCLKEHQCSILNNKIINNNIKNIDEKEDKGDFDSDKENVKSKLGFIEVTITRPGEKENYQPCDLFLNDIARLVPRLIEKDCFEIDILDKTCDRYIDLQKHRLYYIISESTWQMFQNTNNRIILTNDQSLGQPIQKTERESKPSFLVFDQFSLAECLADYCKEMGGYFEYTCVEEPNEESGPVDIKIDENNKAELTEAEFHIKKKVESNETPVNNQPDEPSKENNKSMETFVEDNLKECRHVEIDKPLTTDEEKHVVKIEGKEELKEELKIEVAEINQNCEKTSVKILKAKVSEALEKDSKAISKIKDSKAKKKENLNVDVNKNSKNKKKNVGKITKGAEISESKNVANRKRSPIVVEKAENTPAAFHIRTRSKSTENCVTTSQKNEKSSVNIQNKKKKKIVGKKINVSENFIRLRQTRAKDSMQMKMRSGKVLKEALKTKREKEVTETVKKELMGNNLKRKKEIQKKEGKKKKKKR